MNDQTQKTSKSPAPFKQSASAGLLIAFLTPLAVSDDYRVVSYGELSEVAHADVQQKRACLNTARRRILKDHDRWFVCIADVGLKLATDEERSGTLESTTRHVKRSVRKGRHIASTANLEKLSNRQRLQHMAGDAILGLIEASTRGVVEKRIEAHFEKSGPKSIEAEELLKLSGIKSIT